LQLQSIKNESDFYFSDEVFHQDIQFKIEQTQIYSTN